VHVLDGILDRDDVALAGAVDPVDERRQRGRLSATRRPVATTGGRPNCSRLGTLVANKRTATRRPPAWR